MNPIEALLLKKYQLTKAYSIVALLFFSAGIIISTNYQSKVFKDGLKNTHEEVGSVMTNVIMENVWPGHEVFLINTAPNLTKEQLTKHPEINHINLDLKNLLKNSKNILKVKIYDLKAKTIFSTDFTQLGKVKSATYSGSISAKTGLPISKFSSRDKFEGIWDTRANIHVLASYLPIKDHETKKTKAVFELYFDVTDSINEINSEIQNITIFSIVGSFGIYLILLAFIFEGEKKLLRQNQKIQNQQRQLHNAKKLASLGEMAGGVAHEINNPICIIDGLALRSIIEFSKPNTDYKKIEDFIEKIRENVSRTAKIVKGLRSLTSNPTQEDLEAVSIEKTVDESIFQFKDSLTQNKIELVIKTDPSHHVLSNSAQLSQVFINLIENSIHALEDQKTGDKWIIIESTDSDDQQLQISITDSGIKIPKEVAEKMMEPLFTSKEVGKGTGLGLSVSRNLIVSQGGDLNYIESSANTQFMITLTKVSKKDLQIAS